VVTEFEVFGNGKNELDMILTERGRQTTQSPLLAQRGTALWPSVSMFHKKDVF
jgi:hypothetical protein